MTKRIFLRVLYCASFCLVYGMPVSTPPEPRNTPSSTLPHCAKSTVIAGEVVHQNFETADIKVVTSLSLRLGLNETACFHVQVPDPDYNKLMNSASGNASYMYNGSLLYTLKYSGLKHEHPVRQRYKFGIPKLRSKCVCDCSGGDDHCGAGYQYQNCSKTINQVCYTTYHGHQRATGCPTGQESELCCEIHASPYKALEFTAVRIGPPETIAIYEYAMYTYSSGEWSKSSENKLEIVLNHDQKFFLGKDDSISLSVRGDSPRRQLASGMYFTSSGSIVLRTGVPLNQLHEWSMQKLGWFRKVEDKNNKKLSHWDIRGGGLKLQDSHHVSVENCKSQLYTDSYNAEYLVSVGRSLAPEGAPGAEVETLNFHLGHSVQSVETWVKRAVMTGREVIVQHDSGAALTVNIELSSQSTVRFFHHTSSFADFTGAIQLDKYSNRFLNLTFYDARGSLIGTVYRDAERLKGVDLAFSTYIGTPILSNYSTVLSLPSSVNSSRWVCFHPSGRNENEKCKWLRFESTPLYWFEVPHNWNSNQGDCQGCNEMTVNNFLRYLNPSQWLNGLSGTSEILAFVFEMVLYFVIILIIIAVCKQCILPLVRWTVCSGSGKKKNNNLNTSTNQNG